MSDDKLQEDFTNALKTKNVGRIKEILQNEKFDVNWRDVCQELQTVLMKLCHLRVSDESLVTTLDSLFERDPDVNLQDSFGRTAVMHACLAGRSEVIEYLISDPATRISVFDFDGNSVLVHAVRNCDFKTIKRLLETPTGPSLLEIYNCNGQNPADIARNVGDKKIIKLVESYQNNILHMDGEKGRKSRGFLPPANDKTRTPSIHISTPLNLSEIDKCSPRTTYIDDETPHLYLSSPKFRRRKNGNAYVNESHEEKGLPAINTNCKDNSKKQDKQKRQRSRKNSISLPDLRDSPGGLVTSGQNTPSCSYDYSSDSDFSDDVIIPPTFQSPRKHYERVRVKRSVSEKQIGFPSIKARDTEDGKVKRSLTDANVYSHSDDKIHKLKILQKSILS